MIRVLRKSTFATWLHGADYQAGHFGKYMNNYPDTEHPAWPGSLVRLERTLSRGGSGRTTIRGARGP